MTRKELLILAVFGLVICLGNRSSAEDKPPEDGKWEVKETEAGAIKWNPKTGESFLLTGKEEKSWKPLRNDEAVDGWWYNPLISLKIGKQEFLVELFEDAAPNTVANFISLVEEGFYNEKCSVYRVEQSPAFSLFQGGRSPTHEHKYSIRNEAFKNPRYTLTHRRGTIGLARTMEIHSGATEVFVNLRDNPLFDKPKEPYCIFGQIITPLEAIDEVKKGEAIWDVRVVRKRKHDYVPMVTYAGEKEAVRKR
ncbi:MAG: peptidylprolyl isomerase [Planctomycetes bacterium]|nr:peptidylprolyl isomerase [Planctomycetota bacterium]